MSLICGAAPPVPSSLCDRSDGHLCGRDAGHEGKSYVSGRTVGQHPLAHRCPCGYMWLSAVVVQEATNG